MGGGSEPATQGTARVLGLPHPAFACGEATPPSGRGGKPGPPVPGADEGSRGRAQEVVGIRAQDIVGSRRPHRGCRCLPPRLRLRRSHPALRAGLNGRAPGYWLCRKSPGLWGEGSGRRWRKGSGHCWQSATPSWVPMSPSHEGKVAPARRAGDGWGETPLRRSCKALPSNPQGCRKPQGCPPPRPRFARPPRPQGGEERSSPGLLAMPKVTTLVRVQGVVGIKAQDIVGSRQHQRGYKCLPSHEGKVAPARRAGGGWGEHR